MGYVDFWENGIEWLGVDGITDVKVQARLIFEWCERCANSEKMEALMPDVQFPLSRKKIEAGEIEFLDWHWENLKTKHDNRFAKIIDLFSKNEKTRRLMSYFHLRDFGLCSNIGEINGLRRHDLPCIRITDDWRYEVHNPNMKVVGGEKTNNNACRAASAQHAFEEVLRLLPPNVGTAKYFRCDGCPPSPAA